MMTIKSLVCRGAVVAGAVAAILLTPCFQAAADRLAWPESGPVVVLDPGHGGADSGLAGPDGRPEKTAVLELARSMATAMDDRFRVVFTRNDDYNVPADQRAGAANKAGADAFISLHAGNGRYPNGDGITLFVHRQNAFKNDGLCRSGPASALAPWARNQSSFIPESHRLAAILAASLQKAMPDRIKIAVLQAPVLVLRGVKAPAVLIEVGFLLNPGGKQDPALNLLQSGLVRAVAAGLEQFFSRH